MADGKFCNDRETQSGDTWVTDPGSNTFYYAGYKRRNGNLTLSCLDKDIYIVKIATITLDEVLMAGSGKYSTDNTNYYLCNGLAYWTMTPYSASSSANMFYVRASGSIMGNAITGSRSGRPVINLKSDVTFSSGNGTQSNPYVVS